ncbi:hypothetical protein NDU88_004397 [Pleurodeles waltl]|uniref:Uncharacterized protein n=1 Tax=Pleurodeles waltl TaxID=8319 RepID=A0AAV7PDV8_PLEWA|nr:hypothetical protein NDU88_004397 [Pleurodeles waltl]
MERSATRPRRGGEAGKGLALPDAPSSEVEEHQPRSDPSNLREGIGETEELTSRGEIGMVSTELSHLCTDHHKLADRVNVIETTLEDLQRAHQALRAQVSHLSEQTQRLEHCAEDAEGHGLRNNV